jgi:hypothetical protein
MTTASIPVASDLLCYSGSEKKKLGIGKNMQRPLKITARDFPLTEPFEKQIRDKVASLEQYYDRITGCEVVVEGAVHHHHRGGPFRVRVRITLPRGELEVKHQRARVERICHEGRGTNRKADSRCV